jgi:hypothetical protein
MVLATLSEAGIPLALDHAAVGHDHQGKRMLRACPQI